ncbi:hypothetical protein FWF93_00150 [Candidatus Saccharibacteria bacterium]|nr:hypothetical protein [Candidatus Saccharibacteria bacterium]
MFPKKDIDKVLQEARRVIKDGGVGFISVKEKVEMDEGLIGDERTGGSRYSSFYDKKEFKKLLEQNGLLVIKTLLHAEDDKYNTNWLCYFVRVKK